MNRMAAFQRRTLILGGGHLWLLIAVTLTIASETSAQGLVSVTPLGSHSGEFCAQDRALLFEDPSGVRILYDPGNTVDETDPRLGDVHVILVTHGHGDHLGATRLNRAASGTCGGPANTGPNPNSNVATIAAAKNSVVIAPFELGLFLGAKIQAVRGSPTPGCAAPGLENETIVPAASVCTAFLNPGASRTIRRGPESVRISGVPALHGSSVAPPAIDASGLPAGTTGHVGLSNGYVISFTNGLVAYLTGDTGMFGDMDRIISRFYRPNLVVINISDGFVTGPREAAFVIKDLVRPTTVMPSHANEAATLRGVEQVDTRTDRFIRLAGPFADVVLPLSGVTRMFDGDGRCIGCR